MKKEVKTRLTGGNVAKFIASIDHPKKREDSAKLLKMFKKVTKMQPKMWGETMIGFGKYHYRYASGHEGDAFATGFSPRKQALTLYIMPGYQNFGPLLKKLGKYKVSKACLYINKLEDVDMKILEEIVRVGLKKLAAMYPVTK